jgi:peptidoglycan/LPS O-acetylase OafA/YrhL
VNRDAFDGFNYKLGVVMRLIGNTTLEQKLASVRYRPAGFDYMRLVLALAVVLSHTINVCYGREYTVEVWSSAWRPALAFILPMFFSLSGFLVAGSLERCRTLISFLGLRVLRILPALAVDTFIGAVFLGAAFTALPLVEYYSDKGFFAYFTNMLGLIKYTLPGVFSENAWPHVVNSQLWTLPYELECYLAIGLLVLVGVTRRAVVFISALFVYNFGVFVWAVIHGVGVGSAVSGSPLVECFLFGVAGYLFRKKIHHSIGLAILSFISTCVCLSAPAGDYMVALPVSYLTVYIGLLEPKRIAWLFRGDYSYGIFLYGFPVQQAVYSMIGAHPWYINFLLSLPVILALALFSWGFVEKPALLLKSHLLDFEGKVISASLGFPFGFFARGIALPRVD